MKKRGKSLGLETKTTTDIYNLVSYTNTSESSMHTPRLMAA